MTKTVDGKTRVTFTPMEEVLWAVKKGRDLSESFNREENEGAIREAFDEAIENEWITMEQWDCRLTKAGEFQITGTITKLEEVVVRMCRDGGTSIDALLSDVREALYAVASKGLVTDTDAYCEQYEVTTAGLAILDKIDEGDESIVKELAQT